LPVAEGLIERAEAAEKDKNTTEACGLYLYVLDFPSIDL
jgi:hypothetical protein